MSYVKSGSSIPQAVITQNLDSAVAEFESDDPALHLIQIVDAAVSIEPWKTEGYYYYYDSAGQLPVQDSALEGMVALVNTIGLPNTTELYVNTSKEWKLLQKFDSSRESFQGEVYGFIAGGTDGTFQTDIDYWPFASEGTAVAAGDIDQTRTDAAGSTSPTDGFIFAGSPTDATNVTRFSLATTTSGAGVGDLSNIAEYLGPPATRYRGGHTGVSSEYYGYTAGYPDPAPNGSRAFTVKYRFANDTIGEIHGNDFTITPGTGNFRAGHNSATTGYFSGGALSPTQTANIFSFPFQSDVESTDTTADLSQARRSLSGISSATDGYACGGFVSPSPTPVQNTIDRFPFSSVTPATDVGDLNIARYYMAAISSSTNGVNAGGRNASAQSVTLIDTFPYSTPFVTAASAGDLAGSRVVQSATGHQI